MKALHLCSKVDGNACQLCPYSGREDCGRYMCADALALLKAKANDKTAYHIAIIYTKRTNLMPWLQSNYTKFSTFSTPEQRQSIRAAYEKERDVQLILLVRHEEGKSICRIKCPINPLPVKGEFEAPSAAAVSKTLQTLGWKFKEKHDLHMFD